MDNQMQPVEEPQAANRSVIDFIKRDGIAEAACGPTECTCGESR